MAAIGIYHENKLASRHISQKAERSAARRAIENQPIGISLVSASGERKPAKSA